MSNELVPEFESIMAQLRDRITPNKAAAVSAILFSEMSADEDENVARLDRAAGWIYQEISRVDPAAGIRVSVFMKAAREALENQGYILDSSTWANSDASTSS